MSDTHSSTSATRCHYSHLSRKERTLIERWRNENVSISEIANRLGRHRSTIYREIKRGTTIQLKGSMLKESHVYFADTGEAIYRNRRQRSGRQSMKEFSQNYFEALMTVFHQGLLSGKTRTLNIKTFTERYKRRYPDERVPTFKTVYRYIHQKRLPIKPHHLPLMCRLKPRRNQHSHPKGSNKRCFGQSISDRPESVLAREAFGHWEADLVKGKRAGKEPAILTLVERQTRYGIGMKIPNAKSQTVVEAIATCMQGCADQFKSITFDNGSEFASVSQLASETTAIYFAHAYASWERGTNEHFNGLLRDFIPKGQSIHHFSQADVQQAFHAINQRVRAILDYRSAQEVYASKTKRV